MNARRLVMVVGMVGCALVGALLTAWLLVSNIGLMPIAEPTRESKEVGKTEVAVTSPSPTATSSSAMYATPILQPTPVAPLISRENIQFLEEQLSGEGKAEQSLALIPQLRDGEWPTDSLLPKGTVVVIQPDSIKVDERGFATVLAKMEGSLNATFVLSLARVEDQWLVFATEEVR